jgi:hypothetical protein
MSKPKNHHFVSQVHLKNFFNTKEKKIYVFDKIKNNLYSKTTTKTLFSELFSNSIYSNGEIDHETLENDLNVFFEKDFAQNTKVIEDFIEQKQLTGQVEIALAYFAKYGVIGNMRTPRDKKSMDDTLFNAFKQISEVATDDLKAEIEETFGYKSNVPYHSSNIGKYSDIAHSILELMGNLIFEIRIIPKNEEDFFLIPDFSAATVRAKINEYFNPDIKEIAYIGIPLTSKIYLHFHSEKLFNVKEKPNSTMGYCSSKEVAFYNKANLDFSQNKVACENESYLKRFIDKR